MELLMQVSDEDFVEKAAFIGSLIENHARGHQNSNSPYGHLCPPTCLAQTILMFVDNWRPGAFVTYDGTIMGLTPDK